MPKRNSPAAGRATRAGDRVPADEARFDNTVAVLRLAATRRLQRQRQIERIYALGSRIIFELIDEIDRHHGLGNDIDQRLMRYARLDPLILATVGGDRFPNMPLRILASGL